MVRPLRFRIAVTVGLLAGVGIVSDAKATDKAACAAAAETGQRLAKDHKYVAARDQLLVCSSTDCPDIISQDCTQWLGEVTRNVASIVLKPTDQSGNLLTDVGVASDGAPLTLHATDTPVEIDPGVHLFRFERAGYDATELRVEVTPGKRNQEITAAMHAKVTAVVPPPPIADKGSGGSGLLIASLVLSGVGAAGFGLFAGFGVVGLNDQDAVRKTGCAPNCTSQLSGVSTDFTIANVSLVGGIVSLVAAGVLAVVWAASRPHNAHAGAASSGVLLVF